MTATLDSHGWLALVREVRLVAVIGAVVFAPAAGADSGSPSYDQRKQAIDDQVLHRHVQLTPSDDLHEYIDVSLDRAL